MIRIENYFEGDLQKRGGDFRTTKGDEISHGWGIKSLKYTASRYDGVVNIKTDKHLVPGDIEFVKIIGATEYDLIGEI